MRKHRLDLVDGGVARGALEQEGHEVRRVAEGVGSQCRVARADADGRRLVEVVARRAVDGEGDDGVLVELVRARAHEDLDPARPRRQRGVRARVEHRDVRRADPQQLSRGVDRRRVRADEDCARLDGRLAHAGRPVRLAGGQAPPRWLGPDGGGSPPLQPPHARHGRVVRLAAPHAVDDVLATRVAVAPPGRLLEGGGPPVLGSDALVRVREAAVLCGRLLGVLRVVLALHGAAAGDGWVRAVLPPHAPNFPRVNCEPVGPAAVVGPAGPGRSEPVVRRVLLHQADEAGLLNLQPQAARVGVARGGARHLGVRAVLVRPPRLPRAIRRAASDAGERAAAVVLVADSVALAVRAGAPAGPAADARSIVQDDVRAELWRVLGRRRRRQRRRGRRRHAARGTSVLSLRREDLHLGHVEGAAAARQPQRHVTAEAGAQGGEVVAFGGVLVLAAGAQASPRRGHFAEPYAVLVPPAGGGAKGTWHVRDPQLPSPEPVPAPRTAPPVVDRHGPNLPRLAYTWHLEGSAGGRGGTCVGRRGCEPRSISSQGEYESLEWHIVCIGHSPSMHFSAGCCQ